MRNLHWAAALITMSATAMAADGQTHRSLHLALATAPQATSGETEMPWDAPSRLQAGVYRGSGRSLGIYTGTGLSCSRDDQPRPSVRRRAGVFAEFGVAFAANQNLRLEVGLPVGAGLISGTSDGVSRIRSGGYLEFGAVARPIVAMGHALVFLEVGYLAGGATIAADGTGSDPSGMFLALGLGVVP